MNKRYRVRDGAPPEVHEALAMHPELVRELLFVRGIAQQDAAERFLAPHFERDSHDPFLMPDMERAVERMRYAAHRNELVCVWSDYDCDGIPGGVALAEFLRDIGCRVRHYIPHRHEEGYGLNEEGLDELAKEGVTLVVTVDLGTSDHGPVARAKELGMDVIITDHHLPHETLPEALAVLNPYRADSRYPFAGLCGAGVAWKLIQGVLARERFGLSEGKEKWLLDLVGLSTLSDMVPLVDENRMLASYGLLVMRKTRRPGLRALLSLMRVNQRTLSEDDVAFMVTPRINAASRMGDPYIAARLLGTQIAEEGREFAQALQKLNDERKGTVASIVKEARQRLAQAAPAPIIVMGNPKWRPGVLGLVANTLAEAENRPVFLWGREGGDTLKGSCRSDGVINVVDIMSAAREVFEDFGGHEFSGGFSVRPEIAHELPAHLSRAYEEARAKAAPEREVLLDRELDIADANASTLSRVQRLAPFGEGNRKPTFLFPNALVSRLKTFGKQGDHLEVLLSRGGAAISGVSFFSTPESFGKPLREGAHADVVAHLETDFRGRPRLRVVDIL